MKPLKQSENNQMMLMEFLYNKIPLTKRMGLKIESYDGATLKLRAPFKFNTNNNGIAFGGSLYTLALLSGLGLLFFKLREKSLTGNIVIYKGSISHDHPVQEDLVASCCMPNTGEFDKFLKMFYRKGKSKILLFSRIYTESKPAATFSGIYVAS